MKVYFISDHYLPDIGGLEQSIGYLAEQLSFEFDVELLTIEAKVPYVDRNSFRVHRFCTKNGAPYQDMYRYISSRESGKVQAICFFGFSHTYTDEHLEFLSKVKSDLAHIVTFKIPSINEFSQVVSSTDRKQKILAADFLFCLNEGIAQELISADIPETKIVRLVNGIPCHHFRPCQITQKLDIRYQLGIDGEVIFIFTGRFAERKRVNLLVDAFEQIDGAHLVLVGFFDDRFDAGSSFTLRSDSNIQVFDPTLNILPFLQAADCFVSASVAEGMPNALLEALACGLPAIATSIPGHTEVIRAGYNGFLFTPDNVDSLINRVEWLLEHQERLPALSKGARKIAIDKYDISHVAKVYQVIINSTNT